MARKRKRRSNRSTTTITDITVTLRCSCGRERIIERNGIEDVGVLLNKEAVGWYSDILGTCMCPICIGKMGGLKSGIGYGVHPY